MTNEMTHRTNCCVLHGCKWFDENCPVEQGIVKQSGCCEKCKDYEIYTIKDLMGIVAKRPNSDLMEIDPLILFNDFKNATHSDGGNYPEAYRTFCEKYKLMDCFNDAGSSFHLIKLIATKICEVELKKLEEKKLKLERN